MARKSANPVPRSRGPAGPETAPDTYCETPRFRIVHSDLFLTSSVRASSVDLIVTSPPYNVDIHYNSHVDRLDYD